MAIKLIAFDLDDTLLMDDLTLSPYTLEVMKRAQDRGILLVPATGRSLSALQPYVQALGLDGPVIAFNGALAQAQGKVIHEQRIPIKLAQDIFSFTEGLGHYIQAHDENGFYYAKVWAGNILYEALSGIKGTLAADPLSKVTQAPLKLLSIDLEGRIPALLETMTGRYGDRLSLFQSKPYYLEMVKTQVDKGYALRALCQHLDIAPHEVMAIGDGRNDISMLRFAGLGVAMGNAPSEVKAAADHITCTNHENGAAKAILTHALP